MNSALTLLSPRYNPISKEQKNIKIFLISAFILIIVTFLLGFYLFQIGKIITAKYSAAEYNSQIKKISEQNTTLEAKAAKTLSLGNLEEKINGLGLVKISEVKYISGNPRRLAREIR